MKYATSPVTIEGKRYPILSKILSSIIYIHVLKDEDRILAIIFHKKEEVIAFLEKNNCA
jgi:hypothetical protein|tara:strand:- start:6641 stop:6817 length:177 start_codon:yes stop_codon:yes gene_type:complete